ncbi:helix-turn-helix domain-containing protein [Mycoavidus sp. SF9855]|uniref:helix-turn-helix domain-containing protein n=1 Tax=Mycoavidus sp. SF9855 TaxID=2968475 RepID=UPI00211C58B2|nr:helix-turn-helix domain-containing protein [Mycoavidus sp. SF9855]UUM22011.1 DUF4115 domain-containing protein [Mycoavidus sp. SF9855]
MSKHDEQSLMTDSKEPLPATSAAAVSTVWTADDGSARVAGEQLAQLRQAKGWLIEDVSARLKVPVAKMRALEAGELEHLPEVTFAIGIMRSYAKILGTDPQPLVDALRRTSGQGPSNLSTLSLRDPIQPPKRCGLTAWQGKRRRYPWLWGASLLALIVAVLLTYRHGSTTAQWLEQKFSDPAPAASTSEAPVGAAEERSVLASQANWLTATQETSSDVVPAISSTASASESQLNTPNVYSTLHIKVSQDNWISVNQHDGQQVYANTLRAGAQHTLKGAPPFKVVVGNVVGLSALELNGKQVDSAKYMGARQNVARFELP